MAPKANFKKQFDDKRKEAYLICASFHYTPLCTLSMCYNLKLVLLWAWSLFCIFRAQGCQAFVRVFSTFRGSTPAPFTPPWSDTVDIVEADSGVRIVFLMLFFGRHWGNVGVWGIWSRRVGSVGVKTRTWTRRYVVRTWRTWKRRVRVCWDYWL